MSSIIAHLGGNVVAVYHDRGGEDTDVNSCTLSLTLETRNFDHIAEIKKGLKERGFQIIK